VLLRVLRFVGIARWWFVVLDMIMWSGVVYGLNISRASVMLVQCYAQCCCRDQHNVMAMQPMLINDWNSDHFHLSAVHIPPA
jgi:hypothetical protein